MLRRSARLWILRSNLVGWRTARLDIKILRSNALMILDEREELKPGLQLPKRPGTRMYLWESLQKIYTGIPDRANICANFKKKLIRPNVTVIFRLPHGARRAEHCEATRV